MAATKRDYYEVLGVSRTASPDEIRRAHRELVKRYHPDRNREPGSGERFKEIQEAYEILSDREKRVAYDRFGHAGMNGSPFGRGAGFGIEDLFDTFFGGATSARQRAERGPDIRQPLQLTLEDAVFGCERDISYLVHEVCPRCSGQRVEPGTQPITCVRCAGSGELRRVHQNFFGQFVNVSICQDCEGTGTRVRDEDRCKECRAFGLVRVKRDRVVKIPAGVDDGMRVVIQGEGEPGSLGGPPGNLELLISVEPHRFIRREGSDLMLELPINIAQAALGDEIMVPTLDGEESVKIPSGTQSGRVVRVRGKGVPQRNGQRGDFQVHLRVETPTNLNETQRKLLRQLGETFDREVKPRENRGFFDRFKDAIGI
jgi:molecular chaperone DnaJ